ncbi:MAG TPA: lactate utilization protein [Stellaceae bacterium]
MADSRDKILGNLRRSLRRGASDETAATDVRERLAEHRPNTIPARATALDPEARIELFIAMAEEVSATVARVAGFEQVPAAVADYLAQHNLPSDMVITPDPALSPIPWQERPTLSLRPGIATGDDLVGVTGAFAAVAETGTLMLISGPDSPTRNNFLPDNHIVVLRAEQIVPSYEEGWTRLRALKTLTEGKFTMPRTVNFITGPSRTADIELKIELGAHGPRRLHIVIIDEPAGD